MDDSIQIRQLNDYIVFLRQENETLNEEIASLREAQKSHAEELDAVTQKFLNFIEEQTITIENQRSDIADLRARNSRLIAENQNFISEMSVLQSVITSKQSTIDSLNTQRLKKKQEKRARQDLLVEELEQDKALLQSSNRQQLKEIQHLRTQLQALEYTVKTLRGKLKLNFQMNRSHSNLSVNSSVNATQPLPLSKAAKLTANMNRLLVTQSKRNARTFLEIEQHSKSESEEARETLYSLLRRETEDRKEHGITDDEQGDGKEYLKSLDFQNFPILEENDEKMDTSRDKRPREISFLKRARGQSEHEFLEKETVFEHELLKPKAVPAEVGCQVELLPEEPPISPLVPRFTFGVKSSENVADSLHEFTFEKSAKKSVNDLAESPAQVLPQSPLGKPKTRKTALWLALIITLAVIIKAIKTLTSHFQK